MAHLDEWGLGGRQFGSWVTWFLVGGDLYTAYTFVAVPALLFGAGAIGFFAVPYTVIVYPLVFLVLVRLWSVSHRHGFVTPADFVRARSGSSTMALLVAITGIVATMPYIALQLVGIESVLKAMHVNPTWALIVAFAILAAYTYQSGLRAPALIAFVKDMLIYIVIIVAIIYIPYKLGGWHKIFDAAADEVRGHDRPPGSTLLGPANQWQYITLAFGSALALFLYPHSVTGVLASRTRNVIKRNMSALPAYSLLLGLIALLGYMAIAAKVKPIVTDGKADTQHGRAACCSTRCSRTGSPASRSPRWRSARWCRPRSCRSRRRTCSPATSTTSTSSADADAGPGGRGQQDRVAGREDRRGAGDPADQPAVLHRPAADRRRHHPADAAGGRRSASTPGGCTGGAWSPAGSSAWAWACGCSTRSRTRPRTTSTSAARRSR